MLWPVEQEANDVLVASTGGLDERLAIVAISEGCVFRPLEQDANDGLVASLGGLDERPALAIRAIGEGCVLWPVEQEANDVLVASTGGLDERLAILAIGAGRLRCIRGLQDRLAYIGIRTASVNQRGRCLNPMMMMSRVE